MNLIEVTAFPEFYTSRSIFLWFIMPKNGFISQLFAISPKHCISHPIPSHERNAYVIANLLEGKKSFWSSLLGKGNSTLPHRTCLGYLELAEISPYLLASAQAIKGSLWTSMHLASSSPLPKVMGNLSCCKVVKGQGVEHMWLRTSVGTVTILFLLWCGENLFADVSESFEDCVMNVCFNGNPFS